MRKNISVLLCVVLIGLLSGCGSSENAARTGNQSAGVNDVLEAGMAEADKDAPNSETEQSPDGAQTASADSEKLSGSTAGVDVDLTSLSSTMVYTEVYNMMTAPEDYIGKVVKMEGNFGVYHDDATGVNYYACVIQDAAACCSQGIEFELAGDYKYPDDYPEQGEEIAVVGVFDTYQEGENSYCTLRGAEMVQVADRI